MSRTAVFLDRDGVINRALVRQGKPYPPRELAQLEILPDVPEALRALRARGFPLVVVTNQPDVARGQLAREIVEDLHARLRRELPLDAIYTCFHDGADGCDCRKPQPGLLLRAAAELDIRLAGSYMVGDRWTDVEAGRRAGCHTCFIERGYAEPGPQSCDFRIGSLADAAQIILTQPRS